MKQVEEFQVSNQNFPKKPMDWRGLASLVVPLAIVVLALNGAEVRDLLFRDNRK